MKLQGAKHAALCIGIAMCAWATVRSVHADSPAQLPQRDMDLKVLSHDLARDQVEQLMKQYKADLGVGCGYCHIKDETTDVADYASDENPMKSKARVMIEMTNEINRRYLSQLGDRRYAEPFTCGGCHRGSAKINDATSS